jgi:hypothetical protein
VGGTKAGQLGQEGGPVDRREARVGGSVYLEEGLVVGGVDGGYFRIYDAGGCGGGCGGGRWGASVGSGRK